MRYRFVLFPSKAMFSVLVSGVVLALGSYGCSNTSSQETSLKHRERAEQFMAEKHFKEALLEFKNAARHAPAVPDIYYQIALICLQFDEPAFLQEAYQALLKTAELDPSNKDAQLKLGALYLLAQKTEEARARAEVILRADPLDIEGLSLRGHSYLREGRVAQGVADLQKAIGVRPANPKTYIDLARAYVQMNMLPEAGRILAKAMTIAPESLDVELSIADFFVLSGHTTEAEQHYKKALELSPTNETIYVKVAEFYQATHRWSDAENALRKIISLKPESVKPLLLLGDFYALIGKNEQAIDAFREATELDPHSFLARNRLIAGYLDGGNVEEAERKILPILRQNKNDVDGRFFDGRLHFLRNNLDGARSILEGVVRDRPRFAPAHQFLGLVHAKQNDIALARQELLESLRLDSKNLSARAALAMVYFKESSYDLALEQALRVLNVNPGHTHAAIIVSDSYMAKQDYKKTRTVLKGLSDVLPHDPQILYRLGILSVAQGHKDRALSYFEAALREDTHFIEPLKGIAHMLIADGNRDLAIRRVSSHIQLTPNHSGLQSYYGILLEQAGWIDKAEAAYLQAISLDERNLDAYLKLGNLYHENGRDEDAIAKYDTALGKDPRLNSARMLLAGVYERQNDYERAKNMYKEILSRDPRHPPAANNLACIFVRESGNLDLALSYAQVAREARPNDPYIADTVGWIYYHKKAFKRASSFLKEASEKLPSNAMVQYHLGMALLKSGAVASARKSLEAALIIDRNFSEAAQVSALLASN